MEGDSDSDNDLEIIQGIPWEYHPVKAFLLNKLVENDFPADPKKMAPFDVWNKYCDEDIFEGMEYNSTFTRRLLSLRKKFIEGKNRANDDLEAFKIAKTNHPPPSINHRGEPQWNGSDAQRWLKVDVREKKHDNLKPKEMWESRAEYQEFYLWTFRDHIYQEIKLEKYLRYLKEKDKKKQNEVKEKAKKKIEKQKKESEKAKAKAAKEKAQTRKQLAKQSSRKDIAG